MEKSAPLSLVYLSLGSNQGERWELLSLAIRKIRDEEGSIASIARYIETEPWGFESPNNFLNVCLCVDTQHAPRQLLETTQAIEKEMGRSHKTVNRKYQDRIIDIDILMIDDLKISEPDLKVPHPLMEERDFVMIPLKEIMP